MPEATPGRLIPLLEEALRNNPAVRAAKARWEAVDRAVPAAGAPDDPMLSLGLDEQRFGGLDQGSREVGLTQRFTVGKLGLRTREATANAALERERLLEAARGVIAEVKESRLDLFMQTEQLAAMRESRAALADVIAATRSRYEAGLAGQSDWLLARVEARELDGDILHAEALLDVARARLNLALGRDAGDPVADLGGVGLTPFDATLEDLLARALERRPSVRAAGRAVEAAQAAHASSRIAARPDPELSAGYMQRPNAADEWRAEVGLPLPVWSSRKQSASARSLERATEAARADLAAERNRVSIEVREELAHVVAEGAIVRLYETEIVPQAELAYESARSSYLTGQASFVTLLESFRALVARRKASVEMLADTEMHLARLERAVGTDLTGVMPDVEKILGLPGDER